MVSWRYSIALALGLWLTAPAAAQPAPASCQDAAAAEQKWGIPSKLLSAIGMRESGRRGRDGQMTAWPWAVNGEGQGFFPETKSAALLQVQALQASGIRSIDVGCFQVNLAAHPLAFPTLDAAFDPMINGDYAGRFLASLHDRTGSWLTAVASYHSATVALGEPYRQQVFAAWLGTPDTGIWTPGPVVAAPSGVVRLASFRSAIAVWGPSGRVDAAAQTGPAMRVRYRLPRVITPTLRP